MDKEMRLKDGSRIGIIGGGPAGALFAHFLYKFAFEKNIEVRVFIFDAKDFLQRGPSGCNLCAGVIADSLDRQMQQEGIFLPEKRIINWIDGYCLHQEGRSLLLTHDKNGRQKIPTVFRGNGPRFSDFAEKISFDDFLISWAQDMGAELVNQPVWDINFPESSSSLPSLSYGSRSDPQSMDFDLIIGAFGINTKMMKRVEELGFGYRPPSTLLTFQTDVFLGREEVRCHFGNVIHVYMPKSNPIRFATVIPKGDFITISLIGKKDASQEFLEALSEIPEINEILGPGKPRCHCFPRIAVSPARHPFADRLVMIGDSSYSRHYKNGIESAFITAELAARTAVFHGIGSADFSRYYARWAGQKIVRDNRYGRWLFALNDITSGIPLLSRSRMIFAAGKPRGRSRALLREVFWQMFTGNIPYKAIFRMSLNLKLQLSLLWHTIHLAMNEMKNIIMKKIQGKQRDRSS